MTDLKPVDLYFTTEIWQHNDESLGWRLESNLEHLDKKKAAEALREVAQQMNAEAEGSTVVMSLMMHENGLVYMDTEPDRQFFEWTPWVLTRSNLMMCLDNAASGKAKPPGRWRKALWSIEWFGLKLSGHFEARQKLFAARRANAPAPPADSPSELSKPLTNQGLTNVIALRPKAPL